MDTSFEPVNSNDYEDFKLHGTSRNRKRVINRGTEDGGSGSSSEKTVNGLTRSKRRRFDSSSDDEERSQSNNNATILHSNGSHHTNSGCQEELSASTSGSDSAKYLDVDTTADNNDPWSHLEKNLALLAKEFPSVDTLAIQDALIQNEVSLSKARSVLREKTAATILATVEKVRREANACSSKESSSKFCESKQIKKVVDREDIDEKYHLISDNVYDSEESDAEEDSFDRLQILRFLQDVSLSGLLKLRGISERKGKIIIESRPFTSWKQMVQTLREKKYLNLNAIIEATADYLNSRATISKIISKCQKLSAKIEEGLSHMNDEESLMAPPKKIAKGMKLQSYQLAALRWLSLLHENNMNGILADEMGLGKTIQSIAFIALLQERGIKGPFLIVAPASTIDNWDDEFRRWMPSIRTVVYHGSLDDRAFLRQEYFFAKGEPKMDVIITTYDGATRNVIDKAAFKRMHFSYAIFDEAHLLKNMATQKHRSLMSVIRADGRLLLTGTPVQNNLTELLSLLVFAMPHMLSKETASLEHAFTYISKDGEKATGYEIQQVNEAKAILKPFILRRTKDSVALELPSKTGKMKMVPMSEKQEILYKKMVQRYAKDVDRTDDDSDGDNWSSEGLEALHQLRKLANHPLLIRNIFTDKVLPGLAVDLVKYHPAYTKDTAEHLKCDLAFKSDFQLHQLCLKSGHLKKYRIQPEDVIDSGKFAFLDDILPIMRNEKHKILLFSQYTQMLDVVEAYLGIRKYKFARIDGSTPVAERQDIVDRYNNDAGVFLMLLSTRAGGLGINLTGADTVIIHDVDFNPYNDKQAENRCHRLGQKREVTVYRLISKDTIEENIYEMGKKKLELEKSVVGTPDVLDEDPNGNEDDLDLDAQTAKALLEQSFQKVVLE